METGRIIVLKSKDAKKWEITSVTKDKKFGRILECPDYFTLGDEEFLLISPMYIVPESEGYTAQSMIGKVEFDPKAGQFTKIGDFEFIDHGRDIYATQSCEDEEGRRVMVVWVRMPKEADHPWDEKPWNGMMCTPRVIENREDGIHFTIHPNVRKFFDKELSADEIKAFKAGGEQSWLVETSVKEGDRLNLGGFKIWVEDNSIHTDRNDVFVEETNLRNTFSIPAYAKEYKLSIIVEPNLIEIYVDDGKHCLSNTVYDLKPEVTGKIDRIFVPTDK